MEKGIHNIKHTCGRRLKAARVNQETREVILGHRNGDITTPYSQAERQELKNAVELLTNQRKASPATQLVGKVSKKSS